MQQLKNKRITLRYLAKICNLSVSTVSQILNDRDSYCTEKTKEFVKKTARELGYRPNIGYKLMHGIRTRTAAIILSYSDMISGEYLQKIMLLLIDRLNEKGYFVYTAKMPDAWSERKQAMERVLERGVEFMIALWKPCEWEDLEVIARQLPVVVMGSVPPTLKIASVDIDVIYGVTKIFEHFQNSGCRNIRMISTLDNYERITAFSRFMNLSGEKLLPYIVPLTGRDACLRHNEQEPEIAMEIGYRKTKELMAREPEVDAIFYFTDLYALGGAKYLLELGRVIGKDIRIAGYNNTTAVRCLPYPISSVGQNEEKTVRLLLDFEAGKMPCRIVQRPDVFIRD